MQIYHEQSKNRKEWRLELKDIIAKRVLGQRVIVACYYLDKNYFYIGLDYKDSYILTIGKFKYLVTEIDSLSLQDIDNILEEQLFTLGMLWILYDYERILSAYQLIAEVEPRINHFQRGVGKEDYSASHPQNCKAIYTEPDGTMLVVE